MKDVHCECDLRVSTPKVGVDVECATLIYGITVTVDSRVDSSATASTTPPPPPTPTARKLSWIIFVINRAKTLTVHRAK
ncbi:hypothetical protein PoB_003442300 [Plakobranchus ocellatus]|uniref:Uncharacterized protein n=1 Tax=Plakobranchus ocellatus TaxID=259542 RepID=A0AAV4AMW3_9GAST|nr:hypothetical protein PoB_003442300 [Plakobranchus ocellatus]